MQAVNCCCVSLGQPGQDPGAVQWRNPVPGGGTFPGCATWPRGVCMPLLPRIYHARLMATPNSHEGVSKIQQVLFRRPQSEGFCTKTHPQEAYTPTQGGELSASTSKPGHC